MTPTSTLLESLRTETDNLHEALHVHPLLEPLHRGAITRAQYGRILNAFYIAYSAMEGSRTAATTRFEETDVLSLIEADHKIHEFELPFVPRTNYPAIESFSALMGYLYVKEGSGLGGQVISKHLARELGLEAGVTNHFFAGQGTETGAHWRKFLAFLYESEARVDTVRAVTQAKASFTAVRLACDHVLAGEKQ
ncbi:biliverdin-producing heme oxygenase [Kordiimonas gwangyangensis]|uniref:biliverdin-producing heme oxygenase n=2 Tax=Kordiimonas gwangyangensis TaxID=288022 RepID=UPI000382B4D1|nr:biliverdin-producing heme oxygenase [Kordiimonas gwangyangensis]